MKTIRLDLEYLARTYGIKELVRPGAGVRAIVQLGPEATTKPR